jgi:hypothetical protein
VINSLPVTRALTEEVASWSRQLAFLTARLSLAAQLDATTPATVRQALAEACAWLLAANSALGAVPDDHPASAPDTRLLHAIPVNSAPPRPLHNAQDTDYAAAIPINAARLRVITQNTAGQAAWSPAMTAEKWQWTAKGAAIMSHISEQLLRSLAERSDLFADPPTAAARLQTAADSAASACARWRQVAAAWNKITTETKDLTAPGIADTSDLLLGLGRLAFTDPQWTPARSRRATLRDPAELAPDAAQAIVVLSVIHHVAHTLNHIASTDLQAVDTAARAQRLYMPTRALPEYFDIPYKHGHAALADIATLLDNYQEASNASDHASLTLDALAVTMDTPSQFLALESRNPPRIRQHRTPRALRRSREADCDDPRRPGPHRIISSRPGRASGTRAPRRNERAPTRQSDRRRSAQTDGRSCRKQP